MPTDALKTCPRCGNATPSDSQRCDQCGAIVDERSSASPADREWMIGSDPALCQIVVQRPTVSRRHCVLRRRNDRYYLEDLNSSNKTYVNGEAIYGEVEVSSADKITLGKSVPFESWPEVAPRTRRRNTTTQFRNVLSIGRGPQNDIVLNRPRVSWRHAELSFERGEWTLSDAGSSHGTAINRPDNLVQSQRVSLDDVAFFGEPEGWLIRQLLAGQAGKSLEEIRLTKKRTIVGRGDECDIVLDHPSVSNQHAEIIREGSRIYVRDLGSLNGTFVGGKPVSGMVEVPPPPNGVIALGTFTLALSGAGTIEKSEYNGDFVLSVEGLSIQAGGKRLLEDVSFTFLPQELIALMGGSGAGKTTLLKALCGYTRPATGQILYNGRDLYNNYSQFRHLIGYVPQDDIMHPELTVEEALLFTVMLRTGQKRANAMKDVDNVLRELALDEVRGHIIGSPLKKVISGGQRKRVNIAMELLCRPSCLFLDEPTSGLSSHDAEVVAGVLKTLAKQGKTIVLTIHQPSLAIFEMFSALVVVMRDTKGDWTPGRRVYFGPAFPDSLEFFNQEKVRECRNGGIQPSPELLFDKKIEADKAEVWEKRYLRSKYRSQYIDDRRDRPLDNNPPPAAPKRHPLRQVWLLMKRNAKIKSRDAMQRAFLLLQPAIFGLLIVLLFHGLRDITDAEHYQTLRTKLVAVHFLISIAAVWFGCNCAVREIVGELPIYLRERMACLSTFNYVLSKYLFLAVICLVQCLTLLTIVYFGSGLRADFWFYVGMAWLASLAGISIGLAVSSLAGLFKAPEAAVAALPLLLLPMILFGGGIYPLHRMEGLQFGGFSAGSAVASLAPTRWLFEASFVNEAERRNVHPSDDACEWILKQPALPGQLSKLRSQCQDEQSEDLASNNFPQDGAHRRSSWWTCVLWLAGIFWAFLLTAFVSLKRLEIKEIG